jgi:hypothetical protein
MKPKNLTKKPNSSPLYAPGQEAEFKRDTIVMFAADRQNVAGVFQIENEEKEPGFPDVAVFFCPSLYALYEFKVSNKKGVIKFEKTQLLFYKRYPHLRIYIYTWNVKTNRPVVLESHEVVQGKSLLFTLPDA